MIARTGANIKSIVALIEKKTGLLTFLDIDIKMRTVFLNLDERSVEIKGTDPLSVKFRLALAKLNGEGLEEREIPPPPNPQQMFEF